MTTSTQTADKAIDQSIIDTIAATDPQVAEIIAAERERQEYTIELIASENHASPAVTVAAGTCMTNKYAEGYPGRRSREDFPVFLSMVPQNRPASVSELGRRMPMLTIRHVDGTECAFEFVRAEDYIFLGASCLRYEGSEWSIGAGEAYDWIVAKD